MEHRHDGPRHVSLPGRRVENNLVHPLVLAPPSAGRVGREALEHQVQVLRPVHAVPSHRRPWPQVALPLAALRRVLRAAVAGVGAVELHKSGVDHKANRAIGGGVAGVDEGGGEMVAVPCAPIRRAGHPRPVRVGGRVEPANNHARSSEVVGGACAAEAVVEHRRNRAKDSSRRGRRRRRRLWRRRRRSAPRVAPRGCRRMSRPAARRAAGWRRRA
mmetsp:Transcript_7767/g.22766  ORF Transcript_7767/g.22766 Transcript_7767/m.22766 type:complete len:216 (-) Transcript_7767:165-812(-)